MQLQAYCEILEMGAGRLKELISGSAVYGIANVLQRLPALLLLPFYTRYLSESEYGAVSLITIFAMVLSSLFTLGTAVSLGLSFFKCKSNQKSSLIWSNFFINASSVFAFSFAYFLFEKYILILLFGSEIYALELRFSLFAMALIAMYEPFMSYLRLQNKAFSYVSVTIFTVFFSAFLAFLLIYFYDYGLLGVFVGAFVAQVVAFFYVMASVAFKLDFSVDVAAAFSLVKVGFPSIFSVWAIVSIDFADRKMIASYLGLPEVGVYSVGYNIAMALMVFVSAFNMSWGPFFQSYIEMRSRASILFGKVFRYYLVAMSVVVVFFFSVAEFVFIYFLGSDFYAGYTVVGIVALGYMFRGACMLVVPGLHYSNNIKIQSGVEWCCAFFNVICNLFLIPEFGIVGAAFSTLITYFVMFFLMLFFSNQYLQIKFDRFRCFSVLSFVVVFSVMSFFWDYGYLVFLMAIFFCALILFFGVRKKEFYLWLGLLGARFGR